MWESDRGQGSNGVQETQEAMEDKEDGVVSLFLHQIIDITSAYITRKPLQRHMNIINSITSETAYI